MRLQPEYIRSLLKTIESLDTPRPQSLQVLFKHLDLDAMPEKIPDEFLLHFELIKDYGFIDFPTGNSPIIQRGRAIAFNNYPLRLTSKGHEFLHSLEKSEVWEIIKKDFREESVKTIFGVATKLATNFAEQKLGKYLTP